MLLILPLGVASVAALLAGGTVDRVARTRFRSLPLLLVGIVVQAIGASFEGSASFSFVAFSMVATLAFLTINRSLPGLTLVTIGVGLNAAALLLNRGMPVSTHAAELAGTGIPEGVRHTAASGDVLLPWLGDVIPVAALSRVVSIGDLLMIAGLCLFVWVTMRRPVTEA